MIEFKYIELSKLKNYENNIKIHTEEQINKIALSIEKTGFNDPIGITEDFEIVEGHGRVLAAKELGIDKVPCIVLKNMDHEKVRLYRILHNKCCLETGLDKERLAYELNALQIEGIDIAIHGFNENDIEIPVINALEAIEDGFSSIAESIKNESPTYAISFNFPNNETRGAIEKYIAENGKDSISALIIKLALESEGK